MSDLYSLYKLHKIDSALHGLRRESAALDTGREEEIRLIEAQRLYDQVGGRAKALTAEIKDLEVRQKGLAAKIAGFSKKLYDGSVVSPREIENIEKEVEMLKSLSDAEDERLLALYDEAPPAVKEAADVKAQIDAIERERKLKQEQAVRRHAAIKEEFDSMKSQRPAVAKAVDESLLERYEEVRKRTGDVAMADVSEENACEHCGMSVPERQSKLLDEDRLVVCEGCHRILFKAVPAG